MLNIKSKGIVSFFLIMSLSACMTAPIQDTTEADFHSLFPPLRTDLGRIFFYRHNILQGSLIKPPISVNGVHVGNSIPGDYFYIDVYKGNYSIEISEGQITDLYLPAGEVIFIKMALGGEGIFYEIIPKKINAHTGRRHVMQIHEMKK